MHGTTVKCMSWNNKEEIETTCTVQQWKKNSSYVRISSWSYIIKDQHCWNAKMTWFIGRWQENPTSLYFCQELLKFSSEGSVFLWCDCSVDWNVTPRLHSVRPVECWCHMAADRKREKLVEKCYVMDTYSNTHIVYTNNRPRKVT
jgi:hypothetical protein